MLSIGGQSKVLLWYYYGPFPICYFNILLEVRLSPIAHILQILLFEVRQKRNVSIQIADILLQIQPLLCIAFIIHRRGAQEYGLLDLIVEFLDASPYLLQGDRPFLEHLHQLLALNGRGQPIKQVRHSYGY
jgi:hypothetical protein